MSVPQNQCPQCMKLLPPGAVTCDRCGLQFGAPPGSIPPPNPWGGGPQQFGPGGDPPPPGMVPPPGYIPPPGMTPPPGMPQPGMPPGMMMPPPGYTPPPGYGGGGYPPPPGYQQPPFPPPNYGYGQQYAGPGMVQVPPGSHSLALPLTLAIILNWWAGALANKQTAKGIVILVSTIGIALATAGVGALVIWAIGIADTVQIANRLNRGEPVGQWQFF